MSLTSFGEGIHAVVFGASGGIGAALAEAIAAAPKVAHVYAGSRSGAVPKGAKISPFRFDLEDPASIEAAAAALLPHGPFHLIIIATGILSEGDTIRPEKSWSMQSAEAYARAFAINTTGPALIGKHMLGHLAKGEKSVFAALSARVGSISDNRLGGWHAYRAAKAALNMIVRNFALELAVRNKSALAVTLHPGTVETALSDPFSRAVPPDKLFSPPLAASQLLAVLDGLGIEDSGGLFAWDGTRIPY